MNKFFMLLFMFVFGLTNTIADDLQLYKAGKKAFSVGLYSIALENFESYLDTADFENKSEVLYLSGISAYYLKKYRISITYFEGLNKEFAETSYANKSYYWLGSDYYFLEEYANASMYFSKNATQDSSYRDISLLFNALSNLKLNNKPAAINSFNEVINDPKSNNRYTEEAIYRLATLYLEEDENNKSINLLNKIVFDYSDSKYYMDSLSILADLYYKLNEWENAERAYLLLEDNNFSNKEKLSKRLATIYWYIGDIQKSKDRLVYYDDNFPLDKQVLSMLGDIYANENNYNNAIIIYKKLLDSKLLNENEIEENNYRIGTLYYHIKDFGEAYRYLKLVDSKESIYFTILSGIEENIDIYSFIKKLNNRYSGDQLSIDVINRYVNYLEEKNRDTDLESLLIYATNMYPDNLLYSLTYGELLLKNKKLDESLKYLSRGYDQNSKYYSNISYKIGWIYYNKEEYKRAINYFEKVEKSDKDYIKALYSKSIAWYKIGDFVRGRTGFLELLELDTIYNEEISFYLGLIAKGNYAYEDALVYFNISKRKESLRIDSLENIAWSYYHLKDYSNSLTVYTELWDLTKQIIYRFNAANCLLYLEDYNEALNYYSSVINVDSKMKSSSYYKSIEILFKLNRDLEGYELLKDFYTEFPGSELPGDVIVTIGDNRLFKGDFDKAIETYNKIIAIFSKDFYWYKARFRLADCYQNKEDFNKSIELYTESIIDNDLYLKESVINITNILSKQWNIELSTKTKTLFDGLSVDKAKVIPIYIEFVKQGIANQNSLENIDNLIQISESREEINELIYLKSLTYYNLGDYEESTKGLKVILGRPEVADFIKIDAIMLQAEIFNKNNMISDAIDLYLKIYVNFSELKEKASFALFKGLLLAKESGDSAMEKKIKMILSSEFSDTGWGARSLNE